MKNDDFKDDDGRPIPGSMFDAVDNRFEAFNKRERKALRTAMEESDDMDFDKRKELLEELYEAGE